MSNEEKKIGINLGMSDEILKKTVQVNVAALYLRLSDEDREKLTKEELSKSIINQKRLLTDYANDKGWVIYDVYIDDDKKGSDRNRPEWNRLLNDAEAKKFNIVLCKTQSRFTRELEMVEKYIHTLFPMWGIRFVSILDNADTDVRGNKKSRQINGLINEWYLEDLSENIKGVLKNRCTNGFHIGSFALYGYVKDEKKRGHLLIDEPAANVVREVFRLFCNGTGKSQIARILNEKGIPNPTEYKRLCGLRYMQAKNKNSTLWKYFAISDMLINEMYIGNMVQGRYQKISYKVQKSKPIPKDQWIIVEGTHEPIIDRETWEKAQEIIKRKSHPMCTGERSVFAGKVKCINCGYTMQSKKTHGDKYLCCPNRTVSKEYCEGAFIGFKKLERLILEEITKLSEKYLDTDYIDSNIEFKSNYDVEISALNKSIKIFKDNEIDIQNKLEALYYDKVNGVIPIDFFNMVLNKNQKELEKIKKSIEVNQLEIEKLNQRKGDYTNKKELISKYSVTDTLTHEIMGELIDYIEVGKRIKGTRNVPINIHWNF